jgi:putative DNA primase/helicase
VLVDPVTGRTMPRDEQWFDPMVIPCGYNSMAECPRWTRCLREWSDNDPAWEVLLQRWFGYCLMPHRRYAKWMLLHGKVRSGKGTISSVLRHMMGNDVSVDSSLAELATEFGLDGLQHARVLHISEVSELDNHDGERATHVLKRILGRDPITINAKFERLVRNVMVKAAPMVQANEIPKLPNKARGLSSKMLVLPFDVSFEGREQFDLIDELTGELPGIAAWAARGAGLLEKEKHPPDKFPQPERSQDAVRMYHLVNNPFDYFLEARFSRNPDGFVHTRVLRSEWKHWLQSNNVKMQVPDNMLSVRVCQGSSWDLHRGRQPGTGARVIFGLSLKKDADDEA